jgi:hypothetical protein
MENSDFRIWGEAALQPLNLYLLQFAEAKRAICHDPHEMELWYTGHQDGGTACASRVAALQQTLKPQAMLQLREV